MIAPPLTAPNKPFVYTLCGSTRFPTAFDIANMHLSMLGYVVIGLGLMGHTDYPVGAKFLTSDGNMLAPAKVALDELHKRKIDLADGIFVINVAGYIGKSTISEIEYAYNKGKRIDFMFAPPNGAHGWIVNGKFFGDRASADRAYRQTTVTPSTIQALT